ncbi:MAG: hypothetical protein LBD75_00335 [Candidatus Peribacteria bacterium]|nr:hypothetical protein [Candidatus Peribacteria bacterium]
MDAMRKTLSQRYRGKKMIGTLALQCVKDFFHIAKKADTVVREQEIIEGYVKNDKLFLKTTDLYLKIQIFKQKKELLILINQRLQTLGYRQQLSDIFLK